MQKKLFLFFVLISSAVFAQKKPLDHSVYDGWQSVGSKQLTNNGLWASFVISPQEGDGNLYFQETLTPSGRKLTVPRGTNLSFSNDSKFAALAVKPLFKDVRQAKIKKKKPDEMTKDTLAIVNLTTLSINKIPRVKSFSFPDKGAAIIAYNLEKPLDTAKKTRPSSAAPEKNDSDLFADEPATGAAASKEGTDLIVKNLTTGIEKTYKYVTEYAFSNDGKQLVFTSSGSKKDKDAKPGVFLLNTEKWTLKTLVKDKGNFKGFTFDEESEHLAFLGETDPEKKEIKDYNIYYNSLSLDTAQVLVDNEIPGLPTKYVVSADGRLNFSKDGTRLFFGIAPEKKPKDTTLVDFENAKLDIWGYKDDYLQTMQLKNADRESKRSYLSVIDVYSSDPKIVPLTDTKMPDASLVNEGDASYVLASTDFGNRIATQWTGGSKRDYYLVDIKNGSRKKIIEGLNGQAMASPGGQYILYFNNENGNWYTYQTATGKVTQLNSNMSVKFADEENDVPDYARSYGIAGWTEEDKLVLINDRYDVWAFSPDGKSAPRNVTIGFGRSNNITLRVERISVGSEQSRGFRNTGGNSDDRFFKKNEVLYFDAFNNATKENGIFRKAINDNKLPEQLTMEKAKFSSLVKAKDADLFIYDKGSYINSPDVYISKDFKTATKLSSTNPQQANYNWGTTELVKWTTPKGYKSEGILYKPENFDPNKKYPMIVYFYEKLSDGLYTYQAPAPTPSRLNIPFFVSNGYLVFAPDISYEIGYPGKSAEEFINSGVEHLKKNAWVDGTKIGIQGQSWGGYQVAHLITVTDMYAAAWAGAPVVNMTSAYGGIRWESGMNRQFQYEKTQSRIGATLWEKPELYIQNSPLFNFPKVKTPVVVMANDADGAVPWYQGIEMFTGLRRLGKPVWMLNYNNEAHNLVQRQNRKDIQIREQQFFDYYLKGAKAPVWMVSGVPATEKGKTWGFELTDEKP
ncbi:prolyl oligopeptidase family serine peptidase [Pedobacter sp. SL55]|uniref:S9 family peptidase n=1 Tax=Pedobacter sp. SL55 TaxID=2995161 RepID=UPI00226F07BC|nr:prolyl oligopeptidase family serine peptidase [Pedobacter sp. SL55]WAC39923.1 prolyl oligopeptidase family serine peptidase [Pedobacter sp. SL55]